MSNQSQVALALLQAHAVLLRPHQPFTFASGIKSPIYCDNRLLIGNVATRQIVSDAFAALVTDVDVVAGTATAGIPWAAWVPSGLPARWRMCGAAPKHTDVGAKSKAPTSMGNGYCYSKIPCRPAKAP
jgi:orotate phosphoribosyltransferase